MLLAFWKGFRSTTNLSMERRGSGRIILCCLDLCIWLEFWLLTALLS